MESRSRKLIQGNESEPGPTDIEHTKEEERERARFEKRGMRDHGEDGCPGRRKLHIVGKHRHKKEPTSLLQKKANPKKHRIKNM